MPEQFDLVVIGSGSAGAGPAYECRRAGWKVAVVDDLPFGGTCALRGCDPKKVLVGAAELVDWQRRMRGKGIAGEAAVDWPELIRFKRTFTESVPESRAASLAAAGIAAYRGAARFLDAQTIDVAGERLTARHFVIAAGATPRPLGIPGEEHVVTSTDFLELAALPRRILFVGAGYISFEFAHVARRAGAHVAIIGRGRPLRQFDADLVARLVDESRRIGIAIELDAEVAAIERAGTAFRVTVNKQGGASRLETDLIVHGAGRVPKTAALDLQAAQVATHENGAVVVNEFLQSTTNPRVYAAGDAAGSEGPPLTPVAGHEGRIVAANLLHGNSRTPDYRAIPSVVFTIPPLAQVGLTEAAARERGSAMTVHLRDTSEWYASRRIGEEASLAKVLVETGTERILGAHLLGHNAEELVNLFALAMRFEIRAGDLAEMLYAYPTHGSNVRYLVR